MSRLLDWLIGIAVTAIMLSAYAQVQSADEWADARRAAEAREEMKELIRGME